MDNKQTNRLQFLISELCEAQTAAHMMQNGAPSYERLMRAMGGVLAALEQMYNAQELGRVGIEQFKQTILTTERAEKGGATSERDCWGKDRDTGYKRQANHCRSCGEKRGN